MKVWAVFCCVAAVSVATEGAAVGCNVSIGFDTYREDVLASGIVQPDGMAVDFTTNTLYFSLFNGSHASAKLDLSTKVINKIEELDEKCSFTVDRVHDEVHAGCGHYRHGTGLYQFDSNVNRFVQTAEENKLINFVHYNKVLYYSYYPSPFLRIFRRGHSIRVEDLTSEVSKFVIDKHKDRIFYNSTGLFRQRAGAVVETRYEELDKPHAVAVDENGDTYACNWGDKAGIYLLHEKTASVTKLLNINWCSSLAFDRDNNMIYPDNTRIIRLVKC